MTYLEIVNAVLADAFAESKRASAKQWVTFRYNWLWDLEDWTFAKGTDAVTVTSGSQVVSGVATDFSTALGLYDARGNPLTPVRDYRDFAAMYVGTDNAATGTPEAFTVVGSSIFVGPTSNETSSGYLLVHEKIATPLVNDGDVPNIPLGHHLSLVHGAKAEGFKLSNISLAADFDADFQADVQVMQRKYKSNIKEQVGQMGSPWRPGG